MDEKKNAREREPRSEEATEKEESKKQPGSNKRTVFFGILGAVVVLNALVAFVLVQVTRPEDPEAVEQRLHADSLQQESVVNTTMGAVTEKAPIEVVVNIAGTEGQRFLKTAVLLEFDDKAYPALVVELERRVPKHKDLLLNHLSKMTLMELTEPDARDKIRKDIIRLINNALPPKIGEIRDVLFTQYIIQ